MEERAERGSREVEETLGVGKLGVLESVQDCDTGWDSLGSNGSLKRFSLSIVESGDMDHDGVNPLFPIIILL